LGGAVVGLAGGVFFGFFEPVGLAFDRDDFGMMDQAVDEGHHTSGVGKDLVPLGEGFIGGDESGFGAIAPGADVSALEVDEEAGGDLGAEAVVDAQEGGGRGVDEVKDGGAIDGDVRFLDAGGSGFLGELEAGLEVRSLATIRPSVRRRLWHFQKVSSSTRGGQNNFLAGRIFTDLKDQCPGPAVV